MKNTGIIRRVDSLGRVVIPKEIRRSLDISDGDQLEIWVDDGKVIYSKYHDDRLETECEHILGLLYDSNLDDDQIYTITKNVDEIKKVLREYKEECNDWTKKSKRHTK